MMREHDTVESATIDDTQEHTQDDDQPPRKRRRYYYNLLDRDISRGSLNHNRYPVKILLENKINFLPIFLQGWYICTYIRMSTIDNCLTYHITCLL